MDNVNDTINGRPILIESTFDTDITFSQKITIMIIIHNN